jgi:hypothetical protein
MTQGFQADQDIESREVERPALGPKEMLSRVCRSSFEKFPIGGRVGVLVGNPGFLCDAPSLTAIR